MKTCNKCGQEKPESDFHKQKNAPDGLRYACKPCATKSAQAWNESHVDRVRSRNKTWYERTRAERMAQAQQWKERNREKWNAYMREYNAKNPDKIKQQRVLYKRANLDKVLFWNRQREIKKSTVTPGWANLSAIKAIYDEAKRMTRSSGIQYDVDHIVPINGKVVTGLHVETNLRIIPSVDNRRKSNKLLEEII